MATVTLTDFPNGKIREVTYLDYSIAQYETINYPVTTITENLEFRIRFETVTIKGYDNQNIAPVGIAVIGVNNYIL